jgi:hypothetical protein
LAITAESITVNNASTENSRKMISTPKNTPVTGALNVAEIARLVSPRRPVAKVLGRSTPFAAGRWRVRPVPRQVIGAFGLLPDRWMTGSCR